MCAFGTQLVLRDSRTLGRRHRRSSSRAYCFETTILIVPPRIPLSAPILLPIRALMYFWRDAGPRLVSMTKVSLTQTVGVH